MNGLNRKIVKYSARLCELYVKMKQGEISEKQVGKLSRKLDKLIMKKMTFIQKDTF
jgi:hypothetical protein